MPQLRVDKLTRKINIHISNGMRIIFSPGIGNILGYNEKEDNVFHRTKSVVTLHNTYNTEVNSQSLFVYCDILETRHRWRYEGAVTSLNFHFG